MARYIPVRLARQRRARQRTDLLTLRRFAGRDGDERATSKVESWREVGSRLRALRRFAADAILEMGFSAELIKVSKCLEFEMSSWFGFFGASNTTESMAAMPGSVLTLTSAEPVKSQTHRKQGPS